MGTDEIWNDIQTLPKQEIYKLLYCYNNYVIEVCDREDGSIPVCLEEYYMNEWQEIE